MGTFREQSEDLQERVNEILMDSKLSVIVEGEHDILAYELFLDENKCHIEQFGGKDKAEFVINEINKIKKESAISILDKDLDAINGKVYPDNVFFTDAHDIDTQMFLSEAFYRVAKEFYTRDNTSSKEKMTKIRNKIISFGRPLSYMRILSDKEGYCFAFKPSKNHPKPFPYKDYLKLGKDDCEYLGDDKMVEVVCRYRNQGTKMDRKVLCNKIQQIAKQGYEDKLILHGHDVMNLMGLLIQHYGKTKAEPKNSDEVEQAFRLTYNMDFMKSTLYVSLKKYSTDKSISFLRMHS